jgi:hypothetical protein
MPRNGNYAYISNTTLVGLFSLTTGAIDPLFFDTNDTGPPPADAPAVEPGKIVRLDPDYARHHHLLDWTGDGLDEIFDAHGGAVYDNRGRRIATLTAPPATDKGERSLLGGDFTGDRIAGVTWSRVRTVQTGRRLHGSFHLWGLADLPAFQTTGWLRLLQGDHPA